MVKNFVENFEPHTQVKPSSEKQFGWVFTAVFAILTFRMYRHQNIVSTRIFLFFSLLTVAITIFKPRLLKIPNLLWLKFAALLAMACQPILFGLLFFCVFTPISFLMRITGSQKFIKGFDRKLETYWLPSKKIDFKAADMKNQF